MRFPTSVRLLDRILCNADTVGAHYGRERMELGLFIGWLSYRDWHTRELAKKCGQEILTNAERDRLTVAANKFRAELAALQECDRRLWTDPSKTRGSVIDKSPIDKAHERRKITHL